MKKLIKDKRYAAARKMIISKKIKLLREIFDIIPKDVMAADLGIGNLIKGTKGSKEEAPPGMEGLVCN